MFYIATGSSGQEHSSRLGGVRCGTCAHVGRWRPLSRLAEHWTGRLQGGHHSCQGASCHGFLPHSLHLRGVMHQWIITQVQHSAVQHKSIMVHSTGGAALPASAVPCICELRPRTSLSMEKSITTPACCRRRHLMARICTCHCTNALILPQAAARMHPLQFPPAVRHLRWSPLLAAGQWRQRPQST